MLGNGETEALWSSKSRGARRYRMAPIAEDHGKQHPYTDLRRIIVDSGAQGTPYPAIHQS